MAEARAVGGVLRAKGGAVVSALFIVLACMFAFCAGALTLAIFASNRIHKLDVDLAGSTGAYLRQAYALGFARKVADEAMTMGLAECERLRKEAGHWRERYNGTSRELRIVKSDRDTARRERNHWRAEAHRLEDGRSEARYALARANAEVSEIQDAAVRQGMRLAADMIDDAAGKGHRFASMAKMIREQAARPPTATKRTRAA